MKKKSSTLGINKTSESPPMLRREEMQHSANIGLGNDFQRGAPCRSSLQDLNSTSNVRYFYHVLKIQFLKNKFVKSCNELSESWSELFYS